MGLIEDKYGNRIFMVKKTPGIDHYNKLTKCSEIYSSLDFMSVYNKLNLDFSTLINGLREILSDIKREVEDNYSLRQNGCEKEFAKLFDDNFHSIDLFEWLKLYESAIEYYARFLSSDRIKKLNEDLEKAIILPQDEEKNGKLYCFLECKEQIHFISHYKLTDFPKLVEEKFWINYHFERAGYYNSQFIIDLIFSLNIYLSKLMREIKQNLLSDNKSIPMPFDTLSEDINSFVWQSNGKKLVASNYAEYDMCRYLEAYYVYLEECVFYMTTLPLDNNESKEGINNELSAIFDKANKEVEVIPEREGRGPRVHK